MSLSNAVSGREVCLSWDPAVSVDFCGLSLFRLDAVTDGSPTVTILGAGKHQKITLDEQVNQISRAVDKLHDAGARGVDVVIDAGGSGRGVMDVVRARGSLTANAKGISLHGGSKSFFDRQFGIIRAAKTSVISHLDAAFGGKRIRYNPDAPGIGMLIGEIQMLRADVTGNGSVTIKASTSEGSRHDDLIMALAQGYYAMTSPEYNGSPLWSTANVAYFEQLSAARAPAEYDYGSEVRALEEPQDTLLPVRKTPYRYRMR